MIRDKSIEVHIFCNVTAKDVALDYAITHLLLWRRAKCPRLRARRPLPGEAPAADHGAQPAWRQWAPLDACSAQHLLANVRSFVGSVCLALHEDAQDG